MLTGLVKISLSSFLLLNLYICICSLINVNQLRECVNTFPKYSSKVLTSGGLTLQLFLHWYYGKTALADDFKDEKDLCVLLYHKYREGGMIPALS